MMELKNKKEMKVHTDTEDKFRQISFPAIILIGSNKSLDEPTSIIAVTAYQLLHKKQGDVILGYEKLGQPFCYEKLTIHAVDNNIVLAELIEMENYAEVNTEMIEFVL